MSTLPALLGLHSSWWMQSFGPCFVQACLRGLQRAPWLCFSSILGCIQVGDGLQKFIGAGRRSELFMVSKVWNDQHRPADVRYASWSRVNA